MHGLLGDAHHTWTYQGASHDEDVFWPEDLLPKDMANTRIFSFGYDADIVKFTSQSSGNSIIDHANNLVAEIAGQSTNEEAVGSSPG